MNKRSIVLPGQSRSTSCSTRGCHRLDGHKGEHRSTLRVAPVKASAVKPSVVDNTEGVEVLSWDKYTVQPETKSPVRQARKARRPKVVVIPMADYRRVVAAGIKVRRSRGYIVSGRPSARLA